MADTAERQLSKLLQKCTELNQTFVRGNQTQPLARLVGQWERELQAAYRNFTTKSQSLWQHPHHPSTRKNPLAILEAAGALLNLIGIFILVLCTAFLAVCAGMIRNQLTTQDPEQAQRQAAALTMAAVTVQTLRERLQARDSSNEFEGCQPEYQALMDVIIRLALLFNTNPWMNARSPSGLRHLRLANERMDELVRVLESFFQCSDRHGNTDARDALLDTDRLVRYVTRTMREIIRSIP